MQQPHTPSTAMKPGMAAPQVQAQEGPASAEEQEQYDLLVKFASIMLHHEQTQPAYLKLLQKGESVPEAVGRVVAILARQFETQSKAPLSEAVQGEALPDLLEDVFELAIMAGLMDESEIDEVVVEQATKTAVRNYTNQALITGQLNETNLNEKLEQLKATPDGAKAYAQMQSQQGEPSAEGMPAQPQEGAL